MNKIIIKEALKNRKNWIRRIKNQGTNFGTSSDWLEKKLKE